MLNRDVIGILQGRLSPAVDGRLQAFPGPAWENEFELAKACGFGAMELVFEKNRSQQNPLSTEEGINRIQQLSQTHGILVPSICMDYLIERPFVRASAGERLESISILKKLIVRGARLGIKRILVPILEASEIRTEEDRGDVVASLKECLPLAENHHVELALETSLSAEESLRLFKEIGQSFLKIYYDLGNAVALGYDAPREIRLLGPLVTGVHVKDRRRGGPSVPLGTGDVDFPSCFRALGEIGYRGPYMLQAARAEDYLGIARRQLRFVKEHLSLCRQEAPT